MDDALGALELIVVIGGAVSVIAGAAWVAIQFGRRLCRVLPAIDGLHELFGDNPIEELHRLCVDTRASVGEIEIRQRIAERHLTIGVYVTDTAGRCTWANDYLCDAFGIDSSDMRGFGWLSAILENERFRVHQVWSSAVENQLPYEQHYTVAPRDGRANWRAYTEAWPVRVAEKIICYVGYVREDETPLASTEGSGDSVESGG